MPANNSSAVPLAFRFPQNLSVSRIISIGTLCTAAAHLKSAGLRDAAYPFDWLFSNPSFIADCIEDDFQTFLNPQYLRPIDNGGRCRHEFYQARYPMGENAIFNHHDPSKEPHRGHFERAITRFKVALRSPTPPLLFMVMDIGAFSETTIAELMRIYEAAYAAPILAVLIEQSYAKPRGLVESVFRKDGVMVVKYACQSQTSNGMLFDDPTDTDMLKTFLTSLMAKV